MYAETSTEVSVLGTVAWGALLSGCLAWSRVDPEAWGRRGMFFVMLEIWNKNLKPVKQ